MKKERSHGGYQRPGSNTIVLSSDPILIWLFALPFLLVGLLFVAAPWGLASNSAQIPIGIKLVISAMGLGSAMVAVLIFRAGLAQVLLDRSNNRVIIGKRFSKRILRTIDCQSISAVTIDTDKDSDGDTTYRVQLELKSGETIPLNKAYVSIRETAEYERDRIRHLLKNPYDSYSKKDRTPWLFIGNSQPFAQPQLKTFVIICATITVAPFAGWWLATQEKPTLQITAGEPSPELSSKLHQRAENKIANTEKILFVATPEPGHEGMAKIVFIPFAIVWTIFSGCWLCAAIAGSIRTRSIMGWFMVLCGLPFVGIGLGMLTIPYFAYKRELHTIYALTEERALVFSNDGVKELVNFSDEHFGPIEAKTYGKTSNDKKMDLLFRSSLDPKSPGATVGFWGIEKGEMAKAILEDKLKGRK